jgi:hypothetical protein
MTRTPDVLAEIKTLYYATTKATVVRDLDRAIDLLKALPSDEDREKAAVYMDGLAQMRSEWGVKSAPAPARGGTPARGPKTAPVPPRPARGGRAPAAKPKAR